MCVTRLYGKAYCKEALGVDVKIGFNPDSFGHAAGLPTILKQSGYGYYVFMRPGDQEQEPDKKLPLLFWWEGPDGSRVLTLRILGSYDSPAAANTRPSPKTALLLAFPMERYSWASAITAAP